VHPAADGKSDGAEQREHDADHQRDHPDCPQQGHPDVQSEQHEHDPEKNHGLDLPTYGEDESPDGQDRQVADVTLIGAPALMLMPGQIGSR
jgi:hypothetical protein